MSFRRLYIFTSRNSTKFFFNLVRKWMVKQ